MYTPHDPDYGLTDDASVSPQPDGTPDNGLPFVGRERDLARLVAFADNAVAAHTLSVLWIRGEAGIGKSRLLREALSGIDENIVSVQLRFFSESPRSLTKALSSALTTVINTHLPSTPTPTEQLPDVLSSLRTLARVKSTLLILEDVHLLDTNAMSELVTILHGLEREPLGVICTARPGNETIYGAVLPFLVDTIDLKPLTIKDIREMGTIWGYDLRRHKRLTQYLLEHTQGVPLIVQSVLNSFLSSREELKSNPIAVVRRIADETTESLTHGLTRGLSEEELNAARLLATLGEIFSIEEAEYVLDDPQKTIERLCHVGILIRSFRESEPLIGPYSAHPPYEFSHSLLHDRLLQEAPPPGPWLVELLLSDASIYSTVPYSYCAQIQLPDEEWGTVCELIELCLDLANETIDSPNWEIASVLINAAWELYNRHAVAIPEPQRTDLRFQLLERRLHALNAFPSHPDFIDSADQLLELTADPKTEEEALRRFAALEFAIFRTDEGWNFRTEEIFEETERIVTAFPELIASEPYTLLLGNLTGAMRVVASSESLGRIRIRFNEIVRQAEERNDEELRKMAYLMIAPTFITRFETEEDLEDRKRLAYRIMSEYEDDVSSGRFVAAWPRFLDAIGHYDEARQFLTKWSSHPLSGFDISRQFALRLLELLVNSAAGDELSEIERQATVLLEEFRQVQGLDGGTGKLSLAQTAVGVHVILLGTQRGELEWAVRTASELCDDDSGILRYMAFERATLTGDTGKLAAMYREGSMPPTFAPIYQYLCTDPAGCEEEYMIEAVRALTHTPVIQRQDILHHRLIMALVAMSPYPDRAESIRNIVREAVADGFRWLHELALETFVPPYADLAQHFFSPQELEALRGTVSNSEHETTSDSNDPATKSPATWNVSLSMLGEITLTKPNERPKKVRGMRMKHALAAFVANELAEEPLTLSHFRAVATESDDAEEGASYLRILVSRLRKQLGKDAILSDGKTAPRLNLTEVHVDLIEISELIKQCIESLRSRHIRHAHDALIDTLAILDKGEAYPEMEDDFFTAARSELAQRLDSAVRQAVDMLRSQGDENAADNLEEQAAEYLGEG